MMSKDKQSRQGQEFLAGSRLRQRASYRVLGAVSALITTMVPFHAMAAPVVINIADADVAKAITINVGVQSVMGGNDKAVVINLLGDTVQDGVVINVGGGVGATTTRVNTNDTARTSVVAPVAKSVDDVARTSTVAPVSKHTDSAERIPVVAPVVKPTGGAVPTSTFLTVPTATVTNGVTGGENTKGPLSQSSTVSSDMRVQFNELAPRWAQETLQALARENRLGTTREMDITESITRKEGAILTARAYNLLRRQEVGSLTTVGTKTPVNLATSKRIHALMDEFMPELQALGLGSAAYIATTKHEESSAGKLNISGEIRYSYMHNTGDTGNNYNKGNWRMRLYANKQLAEQWTMYSLVEYNHSTLSGPDDNLVTQSNENDGKLQLSRLYAVGKYNWFDIPFTINAGRTYAYLANGTVMDSDLKGVIITAQPKENLSISSGHGKVNSNQSLTYVEGIQHQGIIDYMAGYYHWNHYDNPVTILYGGLNYYWGNYTVTGQYLRANKADGSGAKDGYQMTVTYGKNFPWIAHTYEFNVDYYDLPGTTYINHTMNGLGGRMNGFTGWGTRFYYSLRPDLMVSLQYYDLQDKTTKKKGRTLWGEINWGI